MANSLTVLSSILIVAIATAEIYGEDRATAEDERLLDSDPFRDLCESKFNALKCGGPLAEFHCDFFKVLPKNIELDPPHPVLQCFWKENAHRQSEEGIARSQGWGWEWNIVTVKSLVIFRNSRFEKLNSRELFREAFSPVTSEEEAIAFAQVYSIGVPYFSMKPLSNLSGGSYKIPKKIIRPTHVNRGEDGFLMNLYTPLGHCANSVSEIQVHVGFNGDVRILGRQEIWASDRQPRCIG